MTDSKTVFKEGARVLFKDGRNTRVGFIVLKDEGDVADGYNVLFKIRETNQNRVSRIATTDLATALADEPKPAFKVGDQVVVVDGNGDKGQAGKVVEIAPMIQASLEPQYAITFKDENGKTALAWYGEAILAAAL